MTAYTHDLVQGEERCFEIAQERVRKVIETGATELDLSNLGELQEFPDLGDVPERILSLNLTRCWGLKNFDIFAKFRNLEVLDYKFCQWTDLEPLRVLTNLRNLILFKAVQLKNIEGLDSLKNLTKLSIRWSNPDDLAPLSRSAKLKWLDLSRLPITDTSAFAALSELEYLNLYWCENLLDIEHLAGLPNLASLVLSRCQKLKSIASVRGLTQLRALYLWICKELVDLSPLERLHKITTLHVGGSQIESLSP